MRTCECCLWLPTGHYLVNAYRARHFTKQLLPLLKLAMSALDAAVDTSTLPSEAKDADDILDHRRHLLIRFAKYSQVAFRALGLTENEATSGQSLRC